MPPTRSLDRLTCFAFICSFAGMVAGCAFIFTTYEVPTEPISFADERRIEKRVLLVLTPDLEAANHVLETGGWRQTCPIGEPIAMNAEALARAIFADVQVHRGSAATAESGGFDAILEPSVTHSSRNRPPTIFGDQTLAATLKWTLTAPSGELLWVESVNGKGTAKLAEGEDQIELLMDDLFRSSYRAFRSSAEIGRAAP